MSHTAFTHISTTPIDSLNLAIEHYEHTLTGAVHYHLACDATEKAFSVALRTMPHDSKGVAHILEHTALCGSEKFPVRDPFFMMTRRSLNTFMNAMTSSDWTAYPFASQNDKDFYNLLDVYLDAVFFSRLDPLDFAQEGQRIEFSDANDLRSPLVFKGVVFNEMKGAMSSPVSQLWQGISAHLFPTTTYHHNSGGDPACITDLTYDELLSFYKTHYHPSNAIIMSFGDLDVNELQTTLHDNALSRFERQDKRWEVQPEVRYGAPLAVEACYGLDEGDIKGKTHHVMGWLLGDSINLDEQLEAHLLSQVLLDNSASPLRCALETSNLGSAPSMLCGLEDSNREMSFLCGLEGSDPEHAQAFEELVLNTLQEVVKHGIDSAQIEAAIHQLELHQREIGGDHYPYGLQLIFNALPAATHYGNPVALLNLEPALERLKAKAADPAFIPSAIERLLLNNRHRVRYTLKPDAELNAEMNRQEQRKLERIKQGLERSDLEQINAQASALAERQAQVDDDACLPQVTLADVPTTLSEPHPSGEHTTNGLAVSEYQAGTNGLVYQQLVRPLPNITYDQLTWMSFFSKAWTEVGIEGADYLQQQQRQTANVGSLGAFASIKPTLNNANELTGKVVMSSKALAANTGAMSELLKDTWCRAVFNEQTRLEDLLKQEKSQREHGITQSGHSYAMTLAAAGLNTASYLDNQLGGLPAIERLSARVKALQNGDIDLCDTLSSLHQTLSDTPHNALLIHDQTSERAHKDAFNAQWGTTSVDATTNDSTPLWQPSISPEPTYWMVDSQVNFCSLAIGTVGLQHEDAPALSVLAGILRNNFLHTTIREQGGAYGGGATHDGLRACFKFYSYRDPRCEDTFDDFTASIDWVLNTDKHSQSESWVEQAILGLISSLDKPGSPSGEAKEAYHRKLSGHTLDIRQAFRARLLQVRFADVQRVAKHYLLDAIQNDHALRAVVAPKNSAEVAAKLGLEVCEYHA